MMDEPRPRPRNSARRPGESYRDCVDRLAGEKRAVELDLERYKAGAEALLRECVRREQHIVDNVPDFLQPDKAVLTVAEVRALLRGEQP